MACTCFHRSLAPHTNCASAESGINHSRDRSLAQRVALERGKRTSRAWPPCAAACCQITPWQPKTLAQLLLLILPPIDTHVPPVCTALVWLEEGQGARGALVSKSPREGGEGGGRGEGKHLAIYDGEGHAQIDAHRRRPHLRGPGTDT